MTPNPHLWLIPVLPLAGRGDQRILRAPVVEDSSHCDRA